MSIPDYVLRGLADDAATEARLIEDERHAAFLKASPVPVHLLIDLDEVDQLIDDTREELSANVFAIENHRAKADALSRRSTELRLYLDDLHDRRRGLTR